LKQQVAIDIERLLQWAYRDELPKQTVGGLTSWEQRGYLGTEIDRGDSYHEVPLPVVLGPPHPDALTIDYVVRELEDVAIQWPSAGMLLLGHLYDWVRDEDRGICRYMKAQACELVQAHARMGTRPEWRMDFRLRAIKGTNNKPMIYGLTKGGRYGPGAHCSVKLDPSAAEILAARFEYFIWYSSLVKLAEIMYPLRDWRPTPPADAVQTPWVWQPPPKKVFRNPAAGDMAKRPLHPPRPRALPPLAPEASDVRLIPIEDDETASAE
jgi:hypothetical protein